jgi:hypothetical protein
MRSPHDGQAQPSTANTRFKSSAQQNAPAAGSGPAQRPFPSFLTSRSERRVEGSSVEPRRTGFALLDGITEIAWYTTQIHRMGKGLEPDPGLRPWSVLLKMAGRQLGIG